MQIVTRMVEGSPLDCDAKSSEHRHLHELMHEHDGLCYFCEVECILICGEASGGIPFTSHRRATREHLHATANGGSGKRHNIVLACSRCNMRVGNKTVAEKAAFIRFGDID